jgi:hypothetical protein
LAPLRRAAWHRGWNFLNDNTDFRKTRDCQSIAGFFLKKQPGFGRTNKKAEKNETKQNEH